MSFYWMYPFHSNFLHFWFRCDFSHSPPPTTSSNWWANFLSPNGPSWTFISSRFIHVNQVSCSLGVRWWGDCLAPDTPPLPPPPPQTWTRKFSKSKKSSWSLGVVVGRGSGARHPPPPPPPQTLTGKVSKSKKSTIPQENFLILSPKSL